MKVVGLCGLLLILSSILFTSCIFQVMGWFACLCFIVLVMTWNFFNTLTFAPHLLPKRFQNALVQAFIKKEIDGIRERNGTLS